MILSFFGANSILQNQLWTLPYDSLALLDEGIKKSLSGGKLNGILHLEMKDICKMYVML